MDWRSRTVRDFDRLAPGWDEKHGPGSLGRIALRMRAAYLRELCAGRGQPRVLDVGCGTGQQLFALACHIRDGVGIDVSPAMIERARRNADALGLGERLRFHALGVEDLSRERLGGFDIVLFCASLEHVADARVALAKAAEVLRPGGAVILVLVHPWHPRGLYARLAARRGAMPPLRPLTRRAVRRCAAAGLRPIDPFGPDCLRGGSGARRIRYRASQGVLAPLAYGSYLAVFDAPRL